MAARILLSAMLCAWLFPSCAWAVCKLSKIAELPVVMSDSRPVVTAKINGVEVKLVADSGAFYSMISPSSAMELKLPLHAAPEHLVGEGVGGEFAIQAATVKAFTLAGTVVRNVDFVVGGSELGGAHVGLLGQNVLRIGDVDYDLANGVIRLMHAEDCKRAVLAYWTKDGQPYSVMDIGSSSTLAPETTGTVFINGSKVRAIFDTGAANSVLSLRAAERAGIKITSPGVVEEGYIGGLGRSTIKAYTAPFSTFKIGDEEIRNTRLRIGEIGLREDDMLIGADFFLSHRVYVATSQKKLYFTYNGGPVFNPPKSITSPLSAPSGAEVESLDAGGYERRGAAFAARHDYERALADLTRACELEPGNAEYFYLRGAINSESKHTEAAKLDFDQSLALNPKLVSALLARAALLLEEKKTSDAAADLDAAAKILPKEADTRFFIGGEYERADQMASAEGQYDLWIAVHPNDRKYPRALNDRCRARAFRGDKLNDAWVDCNDAFHLSAEGSPFRASVLANRGLVRFRQGDYRRSMAEYDASIRMDGKSAAAWYGRAITKLRMGLTKGYEADLAAATQLSADIAEQFKRRGIEP
jgi:tetratricopeptide (TPR) repeat protein/predicted aspartyl protease